VRTQLRVKKAEIESWQFVFGRELSPLLALYKAPSSEDREDVMNYKVYKFIDSDRIICNYESLLLNKHNIQYKPNV
jgi:hypothetical protein